MAPEFPFFIAGGTLRHDAPSYVERQADRELLDALRTGEFCYVLTSRQTGKSSLMVRTAARLREEGRTPVVLDLSALGQNLTAEQWYEGLLVQLAMRLPCAAALQAHWQEHARRAPLQRFMAAVREVALPATVATAGGPSLILFVDEIDAVRSLPFPTDEFFAAIRSCHNGRTEDPLLQNLTFCLLGVAAPTDLIRDARMTPFNIGRRIELDDFSETEGTPLAQGLTRDTRTAAALLHRVFHWTGGHPYMTQRLCQAVAADASVHTAAGVDRLCEALFLAPAARHRDDNLLFVRERLLRSEADRAALLELYRRVRAGHPARLVRDDDTDPLCTELKLSGVVRPSRARRLSPLAAHRTPALEVRNRIYQRVFDAAWVLAHMPDAERRRQQAAYRRGVLRTAAVATAVLAAMGVLATTAVYQRNLAQQRQVTMVVDRGMRLAQEGDYLGALPWFAEALQLDAGNPSRERIDRIRLGDTLRRGPRLVQAWFHPAAIWSAAFSPDGRLFAVAGRDGVVRAWDTISGDEALPPLRHAGAVNHVVFSPDGRRLLTASDDGTARQWDAASGAAVGPPLRHGGPIDYAAYSPDGRQIATASEDRTARIWSAATGAPLTPPLAHRSPVVQANFSPDGRRVATAGGDTLYRQNQSVPAEVLLWDAATGRRLAVVLPPGGGQARTATFSADGRYLAAALAAGGTGVWDGRTGRLVSRPHYSPAGSWVHYAALSPDGRLLATADGSDAAHLWDAASGESLAPPLRHASEVTQVAFSPDGRAVATASLDGTARVWDAASGAPITPPLTHGSEVTCAVFAPEGRRVAIVDDRGTVKLWDLAGNQRAVSWPEPEPWRDRGWLSPDRRRRVEVGPDGSARIVAAVSGRPLTPPLRQSDRVTYAAFSPDGRRVVTVGRDARIWDAATGAPVASLLTPAKVQHAAFSADSALVITGTWAHTAQVWDAARGEAVTPPLETRHLLRVGFGAGDRRAWVEQLHPETAAWDLTPEDRPVADVVHLATLLSGYRIDPRGSAVLEDERSWRRAWEGLHARFPRDFAITPVERESWEYTAASGTLPRLMREGNVAAVREYVARVPASQAGRVNLDALGDFYGGHGDLEAAREAYGRFVEREGGAAAWQWGRYALLQWCTGDVAGYRRTCAAMLDRFGTAASPYERHLAVWTWDLAPLEPESAPRVLQIAERNAAATPADLGTQTDLGAALWRAGRLEEARRRLEEALFRRNGRSDVFERVLLAIVYQRLGRAQIAREYLAKTTNWIDRYRERDTGDTHSGLTWKQWLELTLLRREAEALIRPSAPGGKVSGAN